MRVRDLVACLATFSVIALAACEGEVPSLEDAKAVAEKAGEAKDKLAGYAENLDPEKMKELAKLVVDMEKAPEKAEELLKEHGMTKEQLQQTLDKIAENPEMKEMFEKAKEFAQKAH